MIISSQYDSIMLNYFIIYLGSIKPQNLTSHVPHFHLFLHPSLPLLTPRVQTASVVSTRARLLSSRRHLSRPRCMSTSSTRPCLMRRNTSSLLFLFLSPCWPSPSSSSLSDKTPTSRGWHRSTKKKREKKGDQKTLYCISEFTGLKTRVGNGETSKSKLDFESSLDGLIAILWQPQTLEFFLFFCQSIWYIFCCRDVKRISTDITKSASKIHCLP